jgi:hypothetical protein
LSILSHEAALKTIGMTWPGIEDSGSADIQPAHVHPYYPANLTRNLTPPFGPNKGGSIMGPTNKRLNGLSTFYFNLWDALGFHSQR